MPRVNQQQMNKRRQTILEAALRLAGKPGGWGKLTRAAIALEAQCSDALVSTYLGSMARVRYQMVREAIRLENFSVLIQAHMAHDPAAIKMPAALRIKMFAHLSGV
jgi:AcrR family transcriptional regulator